MRDLARRLWIFVLLAAACGGANAAFHLWYIQQIYSNADGSVDLYIQNESPGADKESNWLPAPKDKFILMLRLYWPREKAPSIIDGTWKIPEVKAVD